jgi:peptidoglycan-N-acetylglucosamine deacetylase
MVPLFKLGSHFWSHPDFRKLDDATIATQLDRTRDELQSLPGRTPILFRFPYGTWDQHSLQLVTAAGLPAIQWDVVTGDPDPKVSAAAIVVTVHRHARNGSIVIMHANGRGRHTAEELQAVIDDLRGRCLRLVTVSELLASSQEIMGQP